MAAIQVDNNSGTVCGGYSWIRSRTEGTCKFIACKRQHVCSTQADDFSALTQRQDGRPSCVQARKLMARCLDVSEHFQPKEECLALAEHEAGTRGAETSQTDCKEERNSQHCSRSARAEVGGGATEPSRADCPGVYKCAKH
eukprot:1565391-Pleurochrysis_carterae.AAC.1